jgi:acetyl esterase/lipase
MKTFQVDLYEEYGLPRSGGEKGILTCYVRGQGNGVTMRPAMLVLPGGGYENCSDREGEPVALYFTGRGYHSFVLDYSVKPFAYPTHFNEACLAVHYIRTHAKELGVIPNQIAAVGFSAGGHLLGMISTAYQGCSYAQTLGVSPQAFRPDAAIYSYPVVTGGEDATHGGSVLSWMGGNEDLRPYFSVENHVSEHSAPAFIWHTVADGLVPVQNSLLLASAYQKAGVPYELHLFDKGPHGLSLCSKETFVGWDDYIDPHVEKWLILAEEWLARLGFSQG